MLIPCRCSTRISTTSSPVSIGRLPPGDTQRIGWVTSHPATRVTFAPALTPAPGLPTNWNEITVGHLVIAHESAIEGWWEAIVLARDGDMLTLKWRDYDQPNVTRHVGSVALLMPT